MVSMPLGLHFRRSCTLAITWPAAKHTGVAATAEASTVNSGEMDAWTGGVVAEVGVLISFRSPSFAESEPRRVLSGVEAKQEPTFPSEPRSRFNLGWGFSPLELGFLLFHRGKRSGGLDFEAFLDSSSLGSSRLDFDEFFWEIRYLAPFVEFLGLEATFLWFGGADLGVLGTDWDRASDSLADESASKNLTHPRLGGSAEPRGGMELLLSSFNGFLGLGFFLDSRFLAEDSLEALFSSLGSAFMAPRPIPLNRSVGKTGSF